jgi:ABC-2 type transport system permease protein
MTPGPQRILGDANVSLSDPGVLRAVLGTGIYLAAIAVHGVAIGALLRHAAGSIGVMFVLLLVAPGLLAAWIVALLGTAAVLLRRPDG